MNGVFQCFDSSRHTNVPLLDQILRWCVYMSAFTLKSRYLFYIGLYWTLVWTLTDSLGGELSTFSVQRVMPIAKILRLMPERLKTKSLLSPRLSAVEHVISVVTVLTCQISSIYSCNKCCFSKNLPTMDSKYVGYSDWYGGMCRALSESECVYRSTKSSLLDGGAW